MAELAPPLGFQGFEGTLVFTNTSPVRAGGGTEDLGWQARRLDHFRSSPGAGQRQRVFGEWPSWPPAPQRARANSLFFGRHDRCLRGASRGFSRERSRRRAACGSRASARGQRNERKPTFRQQGAIAHWCARARVDRLQNSVSGVWLKKRTSVAAEVSGRGLALCD